MKASSWSGRASASIGPARQREPSRRIAATPGCSSSVVRYTSSASLSTSRSKTSSTVKRPSALPFGALSSTTSPTDASRSVARVMGIDQISPLARRILSHTEAQSSEPRKPPSGAKPPFASSSKSEAWRALSASFRFVDALAAPWPLAIYSALRPIGPGPAAGPGVLAVSGLRGAGNAPDRRIALVVKWVIGHMVVLDVVPDSLIVPVRQRVELPEPEPLVPTEFGRGCSGLRIDPADSRNPALGALERLAHRLYLADSTAGV